MKSIEFIKSFINKIVGDFPSIRCTYGFDSLDKSHTIEIVPSSFLDLNGVFDKTEDDFYNDFFKLFPNEIVYIITTNSRFPVSNPIYILQGESYNELTNSNFVNVLDDVRISFNSLHIHSDNNLYFNPVNVKHNSSENTPFQQFEALNDVLTTSIMSKENNYALAA